MSFDIQFSKRSKKFLKKINNKLVNRLLDKIEILGIDPIPHDSKIIVGEKRLFRIRKGKYRILYEIDWNNKIILIVKIDKRERVY